MDFFTFHYYAVELFRSYRMLISSPGNLAYKKYEEPKELMTFDLDLSNFNPGTEETLLSVRVARITRTTPEFAAMSPDKRGCYYPGEMDLQPMFPIYTQVF